MVYRQSMTYRLCLADTVYNLFEHALNDFGTPSRIQTNNSGENVRIWERMTKLRGQIRGSYVAGSSVHNERIERLWRDGWSYVSPNFIIFSRQWKIKVRSRNNM